MNKNNSSSINRRQFLYRTGAGVTLFNILPGSLLHGAETRSPNEKLNVAGIGIGSRGGADVDEVAGLGHNIVALCDVDEKYAAKEFAKYPNAKRFTDYRVMLDKMGKEIDGVTIGTPDHTHAVIAMEAMRRGKHVYCEKPLAHSVHDVRVLMAAAHKYKVVAQLGNQGHSADTIRRLCEWVLRSLDRSGAVPALLAALGAVELARLAAVRLRLHRRLDLSRGGSVLLGVGSRRAHHGSGGGNRLRPCEGGIVLSRSDQDYV
jgi:predicted dehydrogenase